MDEWQVDSARPEEPAWVDRRDTRIAFEASLLTPLFERPSVAMISTDGDGKVLAASPSAESLLGYTEAELLGVTLHQRVHYQRRDGTPMPAEQCPLLRAIRSVRAAAGDEEVFTRKDGVMVPVAWVVAPLVIAGVHTGSIIALHDTRSSAATRHPDIARLMGAPSVNLRLALLADASHALMSASSLRAGLQQVAQLLVPVAADWVVVDLLDERTGTIERAALAHRHAGLQELGLSRLGDLPRLQPETTSQLAAVLRGGPAVHLTHFPPTADATDNLSAARLDLFHLLGTAEAITAPLRTRSRTVGAITLVRSDRATPFEPADLQLAGELATRAAFAVENAMLLEQFERRAESLQRALLPDVPGRLGDVHLGHFYQPADDLTRVGGDWYDAFCLPDGAIALVIGDVAGHDTYAASRMGAIRHKLRGLAVLHPDEPAHVVARLDRVLQHLTPTDMATLIYARLTHPARPCAAQPRPGGPALGPSPRAEPSPGVDPTASEDGDAGWVLEWSSAGHPPPLLLTPGDRPRLLLTEPDLPVGVLDAPRATHRQALPPGATVVFYTDGLIERTDEPLDQGLARLLERAATPVSPGGHSNQVHGLLEHLVGVAHIPAFDDLALLAVQLPGPTLADRAEDRLREPHPRRERLRPTHPGPDPHGRPTHQPP